MLAVAIGPEDDMELRRADILAAVKTVDDGSGVIILTDMFGGTPSNLSISIMPQGRIEVIAGVNLPMLVKLATERSRLPMAALAAAAQEAGKHYICIASAQLGGPAPGGAPSV
jgi:PTS system mannose-specific IIA component